MIGAPPIAQPDGMHIAGLADAALGQMLQTGEAALPVGEGYAVAGVVTLADLARSVHDSRGVPSILRIDALMRSHRGDGGHAAVGGACRDDP